MDDRDGGTDREPGELLRQARETAGLSRAELAELAGVSRVSVREAELGRDSRAAVLRALLGALSSLAPGDLLPAGRDAGPAVHPGVAALVARAQGFRVRRVSRRLSLEAPGEGREELRFLGVRPLRGRFPGRAGLLALMRSVAAGSSRLLARLRDELDLEPGGLFEVDDGDAHHAFRFARAGRRGFDYTVTRPMARSELPPGPEGSWFVHAVEQVSDVLELILEGAPAAEGRSPRLKAWPSSLAPPVDADLSALLHDVVGGCELSASRHRWRARIDSPCVGVSYALHEGGSWTGPSAESESLSDRLRARRTEAGLSRRALAERVGVSAMTIVEAERGREPRRSTLDRLAGALPALSAWHLLPFEGEVDRRVAWEHGRAVHGCVAELEAKTLRISSEGHSELRIETHDLRLLRPFPNGLRARLGHARSVLQPTQARMRGVEAGGEEGLRISRVPVEDGPDLHELRIPEELASRGASFARRLEHRGVYVMHAARARELTGQEGPFEEGTSFGALLPTRRLQLIVRMPRGWWPQELRAHVWPLTQTPEPDLPDAAAVLHPEGLEVSLDRRRRRAVLEVEHPLVGFKYAMSWRLP